MSIRTKHTKTLAMAANGTLTIPANHIIEEIIIENTTTNAITGGLRIGTSDGGAQVVVAQAVAASALLRILNAAILLGIFSTSAATTLYAQAVTSWNSASINITVITRDISAT